MVTKQTLISGGSLTGVIVLALSLILTGGFSTDANNIYFGTDGQTITCQPIVCDSLSKPNADGISSRCYFFSEDLNRSTYKTCKQGWLLFEKPQEEIKNITIGENQVYLLCEKVDKLIKECQVIDSQNTVIKVGGE